MRCRVNQAVSPYHSLYRNFRIAGQLRGQRLILTSRQLDLPVDIAALDVPEPSVGEGAHG